MKQSLIFTCEEITTSNAVRSYSGTKLYSIKGYAKRQVDKQNAYLTRWDKEPAYELVTYELTRVHPKAVNNDTI